MSRITPRPIIVDTLRTWRIAPGMIYALVVDVERKVWIVESCPVGTHFWTLEQAAQLPQGARSGAVIRAAIREGRLLEKETQIALEYVHEGAKQAKPRHAVAAN